MHFIRACVAAVYLVDEYDRAQAEFERLGEYEFGLWQWAFCGIAKEHYAVYHGKYALYFTAKVGVARGVHDVDAQVAARYRSTFSQNGNTAFFFQIALIHNAGIDVLVGAESATLLQHLVDQSGFAMIHVGNNGNITDILHGKRPL